MEQPEVKIEKIDKRRISRPFPKKTELSIERENELVNDVVNGRSNSYLLINYHLSIERLNNIINRHKLEIDAKRKELAIAHSKQFVDNTVIKRGEILNSIDLNDIKGSKLHQKTAALVDLTNIGRLESGLATQNLAVISKEMTDEQLKDYILNGNNPVTTPK